VSEHAYPGRIVIQSATTNVLIGLRLLDPDPQAGLEFKAALAMSRLGEEPRPVRSIEGLDRGVERHPTQGDGLLGASCRDLEREAEP
jgi:hypothetical protein